MKGYLICNKVATCPITVVTDCYHRYVHREYGTDSPAEGTCKCTGCSKSKDSTCIPISEGEIMALRILKGKSVLGEYKLEGEVEL